ncbi:hypothetical protein LOTGIDRAFT_237094 [Lottia gigantea]|uniref:Uncharacterized protein n=1 Tax=Lottia gigantea TaxID=225164 RepID=V3ZDR7_LOTGI|nr:hypothetical protein LOTGIDRAFT_237094 [Lottia gigantea]ESO82187.1 hypothetical protein LOTGIDRAFT_237094 [Lottia gigantea]
MSIVTIFNTSGLQGGNSLGSSGRGYPLFRKIPMATDNPHPNNPGSGVTEMDNTSLHSLDPRKQELLEARFLGTGSRFQPLNNSSTSQPMYDNSSNLSAGSVDREDAVSEGQLGTPDKCRTPTERKRKRKNAQDAGEFGSASKTGRAETNGKKINEYFKQTNQSPSRTIIPASGAKSPSPQALSHTDMTGNQMKALESRSVSDIEQKDSRIDDLVRVSIHGTRLVSSA